MIPNAIKTSFRDFIEPQEYLKQFAEAMAQMKLTPVAETDLPSIIGTNIQQAYSSMMTGLMMLLFWQKKNTLVRWHPQIKWNIY